MSFSSLLRRSKGWKKATPPLGSAMRNPLSFSPAVRSYRADGSGPDFILSPGGWHLMGIVYVLGNVVRVVCGIKSDEEVERDMAKLNEKIEREAARLDLELQREKALKREKALERMQ